MGGAAGWVRTEGTARVAPAGAGAGPRGGAKLLGVVGAAQREARQATRELLDLSRERLRRPTAARGSRAVVFSSSYLYFLVLESSWAFCTCLAVGVYLVAIAVCTPLSLSVTLTNTAEDYENEFGHGVEGRHLNLALRFATTHIVTMGFGSVIPVSDFGYALATMQQILGVLVNVFVFSAVMAKFQSPQADFVFSRICTVVQRDKVPTLLFRLGNLRCHTLYGPEIRLTLLRRHVTAEGEVFSHRLDLEVPQPPTISGIYTIAHSISSNSPLRPLLESGALQKCLGAVSEDCAESEDWWSRQSADTSKGGTGNDKAEEFLKAADNGEKILLHVTVRAFDNIYGGDVCASTTFRAGCIHFGRFFKDMIKIVQGRPTIDWNKMSDLKSRWESAAARSLELKSKDFQADQAWTGINKEPQSDRKIDAVFRSPPEPKGLPASGLPRIASGSGRVSYGEELFDTGAPPGPLAPFCPYCKRLGLLLGEAGVEYELLQIDLTKKPAWFERAFEPATVPAVQGLKGFGAGGEAWAGGYEEAVEHWAKVDPRVARVLARPSPMTPQAAMGAGESMIFGGVALLMLGTRTETGRGTLKFLLSKLYGDEGAAQAQEVLEGSGSEDAAAQAAARASCRAKCRERVEEMKQVMEQAAASGGFLGGTEPALADIWVGPMGQMAKTCLETGLIDVGQPLGPAALPHLGLEALDQFLLKWTCRPSWHSSFLSDFTFNAAGLRSMMAKMVPTAPDVLNAAVLNPIFERAREMDPKYRAAMRLVETSSGWQEHDESNGELSENAAETDAGTTAPTVTGWKQKMKLQRRATRQPEETYMDGTICI